MEAAYLSAMVRTLVQRTGDLGSRITSHSAALNLHLVKLFLNLFGRFVSATLVVLFKADVKFSLSGKNFFYEMRLLKIISEV